MYEIDENGELVFKRKVVMTMTEERAALLDKILLAATDSNQTVILHATSPNDKTEYTVCVRGAKLRWLSA